MTEDNPTFDGVPIFTVEHTHDDLRYVKLKVTPEYREMKPRFKHIQYLDRLYLLDSYTFVDQTTLFENYQEEIHGPALKSGPIRKDTGNFKHFNNCEVDSTSVLKYPGKGWPDACNDWFNRKERMYDWPSPELIKEIQSKGCHIAPVGRECTTHIKAPQDIVFMLNPREVDLEWRLSFSVAETILGQSLPPTLRYVFVLLKILNKMYFPPDVISTYHFKQLIYWKGESKPSSSWREEQCVLYLIEVLDRLMECAKKGFLPHYFLPSSNALSDTDDKQLEEFVTIVENISTNIVDYLQNALKRMQPLWMSHLYRQNISFAPYSLMQQIKDPKNKPNVTVEAMLKVFLEANIKLRKRIKLDKDEIPDEHRPLMNVTFLVYEIQAAKTLYYLWCEKTTSITDSPTMYDRKESDKFCQSFIQQHDCKPEFRIEFEETLDVFFRVRQSGGSLMSVYEESSLMNLLREKCYETAEEYFKGMNKKLTHFVSPDSKDSFQTLHLEKAGIITKEEMTTLCNNHARDFFKSSSQPHPKLKQ